jgi:hypothetical protein
MADLRKQWQDFKKKHPNFEKSKNFKSDVGPQLEKFDKARLDYMNMMYAAEKRRPRSSPWACRWMRR